MSIQKGATQKDAPVLPEVGSMTTLFPGMSLPSFSAAITMALAILSLTDPPAEKNSTLATREASEALKQGPRGHTHVAFEAIGLCNLIETNEGGVPDGIKRSVENLWH